MTRKTVFASFFLFVVIVASFLLAPSLETTTAAVSFEERRVSILEDLSLAIEDAAGDGHYACCIDPPCTMCYMGSWLWDDGVCRCDEMIANGENDNVCPQCVRGLNEGLCKHLDKSVCELDLEGSS